MNLVGRFREGGRVRGGGLFGGSFTDESFLIDCELFQLEKE